jgi:hypothetical protein
MSELILLAEIQDSLKHQVLVPQVHLQPQLSLMQMERLLLPKQVLLLPRLKLHKLLQYGNLRPQKLKKRRQKLIDKLVRPKLKL